MTPFDPRLTLIAQEAKVRTCHVFHCWCAMREMGKSFHPQAFAHFAELELRHVERIMEALERHDTLPVKASRAGGERGTRLPADWQIPADWIDFACQLRRWEPSDVMAEAASFADYWHSRAGQAAVKMDWKKTWQNWVRNSRRPDGLYNPNAAHLDIDPRKALEARASLYERMGRDTEAAEIRRQLARTATVIPFNRIDSENESKRAV